MLGHDSQLRRWLKGLLRWGGIQHFHPFERSIRGEVELVRRQYLESEQRFRALLESLPKVAVQGYDRERRVIYWNEASARLYGYTADEAFGRPLEDLIIPPPMREPVIQAHLAWMREGHEIPADELELLHRSGELVPVFSHHVMLNEHTDEPLMFCIDVDLSDQKQARRELDFATRFDRLTHLPNRQTFEERLDETLEECRCHDRSLVLIYLDIDHFVEINDALGYEQGDRLLVDLARRLRNGQRATDMLSRVSSDEFVLAFPGKHEGEAINRLVKKVHELLREPFVLDNHKRKVTACLGISLFPANGESARELMHNADLAKNRAKLNGRGSVLFFNQQLHEDLLKKHRLVDRLERALDEGEFRLHYQPQVSAISGRIENLEALLRWEPAIGPAVSPAEFIPVAERSDLIHRIGDWVMEEACRQRAHWRDAGLPIERIDINFSGRQINRLDVFQRFESCLDRYRLGPRHIGIELTENVLIEADGRILDGLRSLYDQGFRIAIDDFGTGYSSLSYLKYFPVTALKIDRSFVRDAPLQPKDRAIMEASVFIGHRLGLEVVAEGVENIEQLALIREIDCDLVQGFYFFRPMPADAIERLIVGVVPAQSGLSS
ncbi:putative bifunctional diguanylate cyclase/phosphodiesterase [Halomonas korlensis]|uniref:PAS domain S-box-containing protein/diguanylate cyclase (GGDEF) domain-containing protein n=1 Tax=Halomonas korlensis TaxID=463301 RepID=A0A1I7F9A9_9GAMM|nr:GGDEF domain-containing phosphodiesterase [Halomonas korlensis]SFU32772.1 PAS domain S-box-containing protein/diguanylate cyclase (GGDEF) domain-containing protein [Halomonas korlensis]